MKKCTKCGQEKPTSEYYTIKKTGRLHGSCKECFKKKSKESRERLGTEHRKNYMLKYHYGITLEEYNKMDQNCNICGASDEGRGFNMNVDHCHDTGKVRGLLCNSCNRGLGLLGENNLEKAILYLNRSRELGVLQE
jgi:hypothetical protein